ncbi:flavin reductase family protein [Sphingobacterium bovisgrunnientis]|uniref:flavin reductase family protein n=1 Tax=Sphingobacterium bovisgrunnientis TaxID=1874697 RepID=UPI0013598BEF|nr:flavin reductase [Sphingobacterium bovisgrunnientis]
MNTHFSKINITELEDRKRTAFVNSLSGFKSLNLIGTKNDDEVANLAIFNSVIHIGANPPLMGFVVRPDSVDRHTLTNIRNSGYYTINNVTKSIYKQAHQTSARYESSVSEFDAVGLHEIYKNNFFAPFVKESTIQIGLKLNEIISINVNQTYLVVGEILDVYFPQSALMEDGNLNLDIADSICGSSLNGYHETIPLEWMNYAKP